MKKLAMLSIGVLLVLAGVHADAFSLRSLFAPNRAADITIPNHLSTALFVVAEQEGHYRRHGLDVRLKKVASGRDALRETMQGRADFAVVAETPIVSSALAGQKLALLAGVAVVDGHHTIVAAKGSGIRSARDLVGKRVGVSKGTSGEYFLKRVMRYHALPEESAIPVNVAPSRLPEALANGRVDAISTWEPWAFRDREAIRLPSDAIYTWNLFLVARRETAELHPELCVKVIQALLDAERYAIRHRNELPARLKDAYGMDLKSFETHWATVRLNVSLDHAMLRSLEEETRWVMGAGDAAGRSMPNFIEMMAFKPLETLRPGKVNIVHGAGL